MIMLSSAELLKVTVAKLLNIFRILEENESDPTGLINMHINDELNRPLILP